MNRRPDAPLATRQAILTLSRRVQEARRQRGLSQRRLAERSGLHQTQLSRVESGKDIRISTLIEAARLVGLELLLVPRELYPALSAMTASEDAKHPAPDRPLYALDEDERA